MSAASNQENNNRDQPGDVLEGIMNRISHHVRRLRSQSADATVSAAMERAASLVGRSNAERPSLQRTSSQETYPSSTGRRHPSPTPNLNPPAPVLPQTGPSGIATPILGPSQQPPTGPSPAPVQDIIIPEDWLVDLSGGDAKASGNNGTERQSGSQNQTIGTGLGAGSRTGVGNEERNTNGAGAGNETFVQQPVAVPTPQPVPQAPGNDRRDQGNNDDDERSTGHQYDPHMVQTMLDMTRELGDLRAQVQQVRGHTNDGHQSGNPRKPRFDFRNAPKFNGKGPFRTHVTIIESIFYGARTEEHEMLSAMISTIEQDTLREILQRDPEVASVNYVYFRNCVMSMYPGKNKQILKDEIADIRQKDGEAVQEYLDRKKKAAIAVGLNINKPSFCRNVSTGLRSELIREEMDKILSLEPEMKLEEFEKKLTGLARYHIGKRTISGQRLTPSPISMLQNQVQQPLQVQYSRPAYAPRNVLPIGARSVPAVGATNNHLPNRGNPLTWYAGAGLGRPGPSASKACFRCGGDHMIRDCPQVNKFKSIWSEIGDRLNAIQVLDSDQQAEEQLIQVEERLQQLNSGGFSPMASGQPPDVLSGNFVQHQGNGNCLQ